MPTDEKLIMNEIYKYLGPGVISSTGLFKNSMRNKPLGVVQKLQGLNIVSFYVIAWTSFLL